VSQAWWRTLVIPALGRQRQVDFWVQGQPGLQSVFQDSQDYTEKPCLKNKKQKTKQKKPNKQTKERTNFCKLSSDVCKHALACTHMYACTCTHTQTQTHKHTHTQPFYIFELKCWSLILIYVSFHISYIFMLWFLPLLRSGLVFFSFFFLVLCGDLLSDQCVCVCVCVCVN
jgi:hypothetical protein